MFQDQVIRLWVVVYDQDADCTYTFTDWKKVLQGVGSSILNYMDGCEQVEQIAENVLEAIGGLEKKAYIPIKVSNLVITIYGWDLDQSNPIHRLLAKCYDQVDSGLQADIMGLFNNPAHQPPVV